MSGSLGQEARGLADSTREFPAKLRPAEPLGRQVLGRSEGMFRFWCMFLELSGTGQNWEVQR